MNTTSRPPDVSPAGDERGEIELLLPWYATGRLTSDEANRVEAALAADEGLQLQLDLLRADAFETRALNEAINVPKASGFDKLMAQIDAETPVASKTAKRIRNAPDAKSMAARAIEWLDDVFAGLTPQGIRYGAGLAAVLIVAQGLFIGSYLGGGTPATDPRYQTASGETPVAARVGTFVLVKFAANAKAGDIAALLSDKGAMIVDGPKPGGVYRVRLSAKVMPESERVRAIDELRKAKGLVALVLPAGNQ